MTEPPAPHMRWWLVAWVTPLALAGALVVWGERMDLAFTDALYHPARPHFPLAGQWFLEQVMHRAGKWPLELTGAALVAVLAVSPWSARARALRRSAAYLLAAMALGSGGVAGLKQVTHKYCPRELTRYGGHAPFVGLFDPAPAGLKPGRCWPGGHATAGFGFVSFYFVLRGRYPRGARTALAAALLAGLGLGTVRVFQGAHFMSHTLWAGIWCWCAALGLWAGMRPDRLAALASAAP